MPLYGQGNAADALIADGHYLRARPLVQAALNRNPNDVHALVERSVLEWAFFRFDEAIATAEKAVSLAPNSAEAHTQLTNTLGAKLVGSNAGTMEKMGLARRFRKEAELSVQLDPNSIDALEDLARFYWEAPGMLGGDKGKAAQLVERVTKLDAARGAALKMGFLSPSDKGGAVSLWRAAVAASPQSAEAHTGLGAALFNQDEGKSGAAEAEDKRGIALKPSLIKAHCQLAVVYATEGRWDEMETAVKQARTAVPDDLCPAYQAAKVIAGNGQAGAQLGRAEGYLRAYLAQPAEGEEPSHAGAHWRLGLVLEKEGHKDEAVRELEAAVREDGSLEGARKDLKRLR